mmetsp:Transcript_135448/g.235561  ORF Transcript_135448/g.235561 Transcript_135448/m.235561 type:complete len:249 (+) Transcript_135448:75-821(+)
MPVDVLLNVYDLIEQTPICCGFFHTGVEILGVEYSFAGGAGVYECAPKSAPDARFRESICMGSIESTSVAASALARLRPDFQGDAYSLIFKNCNDFSSSYVKALLGKDIPGWVNRLARLGRMWPIRHFLPPHLKGGGAASTTAPLLDRQPPSAPLFQGAGNSLRDSGAPGNRSSGTNSVLACVGERVRGFFRRGSVDREANNALMQHSESDARELRAAAAARRLTGSDAETGPDSGGPTATPMPNPWR